MPNQANGMDVLRGFVESLPDETIHTAIDAFVRGLIHGLADEFAGHLVDMIIAQIATASGLEDDEPPESADVAELSGDTDRTSRAQDAEQRTCDLCGRVGTRRYVQTGSGWRCAPTATACIGNREGVATKAVPPEAPAAELSDIPAKQFRPDDTPRVEPTPPVSPPAVTVKRSSSDDLPITARCRDCPKTYTLTGDQLSNIVDVHELKGHIVDVLEVADA